jgi:hypothetical protein
MAAELEEMDKEIYKQLAEKDAEIQQQSRGDNLIKIRIKDSSLAGKQVSDYK